MTNYERVLDAVKTVTKESKQWRSNDGETLDKWAVRRTEMAAKRLTEILFTCKCGGPVVPGCDNPNCDNYS